jgi:AraC family transcriptional regulator of adaptative response / DNA-3-methyladenine glycosylase II
LDILLPYRPPYHWPAMLAFLAARSVPATESIDGDVYHRTLRLGTPHDPAIGTATVSHEPHRQALRVSLSPGLAGEAAEASARIGQLFDIDCDPGMIAPVLGDLALPDPGLRLPGAVDPFEVAVRAILGQQITVAAARTLATRFVARFGEALPARQDGAPAAEAASSGAASPPTHPTHPAHPTRLTHLFPRVSTIAVLDAAQLGEIGIIRMRAQAIVELARALSAGMLRLQPDVHRQASSSAVQPTLAALTAIRGIGPWTAHYVAMRSLGWTDAFPPGDVVALMALQVTTRVEAAALAERWRPWRAYALLHLWRRMAVSAR